MFLFLPNLPRARKREREGCDGGRGCRLGRHFLRPSRILLVHTHGKLCSHRRLIEPTRIPVLLLLLLFLLLVRPLFVLLPVLFLFFVPFLSLFFYGVFLPLPGRYISRTTKLLDLGLVISSTRYPDIRLIIGRLIELLPLLVNASEGPYFVVVDHRNVRRLILFTHRI